MSGFRRLLGGCCSCGFAFDGALIMVADARVIANCDGSGIGKRTFLCVGGIAGAMAYRCSEVERGAAK